MKVLFITRLFPNIRGISGSHIIYNRIRHLAEQGHEVGLLSFIRREDERYIEDVKPFLCEMELFPDPVQASPFKKISRRLFSAWLSPFCEARVPAMLRKTGEMVDRSLYEVVLAEFSVMGQYLHGNPWLSAVRRIVSCHECQPREYIRAARRHARRKKGITARLTFDYARRSEFNMYRGMDHILVLTPEDRHRLRINAPNLRISVVPHGVDTAFFAPSEEIEREESIIFVGYYPNESNSDAVLWFVKKVWPRLKLKHPRLKFYIVGRGPTPSIRNLGRRDSSIIVTGAVDDIRPYLAKSSVFICPIRMGSGFRAKLLEAMASGVPVVSTSLAAEGVASWGGDVLFLADTPAQMLRSISLLLTDDELGRFMAANARELVTSRFSKDSGMSALDKVLREVAGRD